MKRAKPRDVLRELLSTAKTSLQRGLRVLASNQVHDADPERLRIETAFEDVKNALERWGKPTPELLAQAITQLGVAATMAANHSNTRAEDLAALRAAHTKLKKEAAELG